MFEIQACHTSGEIKIIRLANTDMILRTTATTIALVVAIGSLILP